MLTLTDEQINLIAERASIRAVEQITNQVYSQIGKTFLQKFVWLVGVVGFGALVWLNGQGIFDKH